MFDQGCFTTKTGKDFMRNIFHKNDESLPQKLLRWLVMALVMLAFSMFIDWLVINLLLGCCEGGVCWPDIYPQCRNQSQEASHGQEN